MSRTLSEPNANPAFALERGLREKVLIVVDEVGRLMDEDGQASSELSGVLSYLRHRQGLPGRILFLSNVATERARWSETFPVTKLSPPKPEEAMALLADRLKCQRCIEAVPPDRMHDLVQVLGFNPRAIETLAVTLALDPLDEIIGADPGMWRVSDREVSPEFLEDLERRLLERTLAHLEPLKLRGLTMLAVHRMSFAQEAFAAVTSNARKAWRELRNSLTDRFFIAVRLRWHAMNPVVRAIALARLKADPSAFATAHSMAADYYLRHFKSKEIVIEGRRLAYSYAELRYHMFNAGRVQELRDVAIRLGGHLALTWGGATPAPDDPAELDERIGVLSALLEDEGPRSLEVYLARCLDKRGRRTDLEQALIHITRACSSRPMAGIWLLKAQIHEKLDQIDEAIQTILDALKTVDANDAIAALYTLGADLMAKHNHQKDAIILLREGIRNVPPANSLFSLYLKLADLLEAQFESNESLTLLREGIERIPAEHNLFSLYHAAALCLKRQDRASEAIALLKDGLQIVPPDKGASVIYQAIAQLMRDEEMYDAAIELLMEGIDTIPADKNLAHLYQMAAELLMEQRRDDDAIELLRQGIDAIPADKQVHWLYRKKAFILSERGRTPEAIALLRTGIKFIPANKGGGDLYKHAGELLLRSGQLESGMELLEQGIAANLTFHKPTALYKAASDLLVGIGHIDLAVELIGRGMQLHPDHQGLAELLKTLSEQAEQTTMEKATMSQGLSPVAESRRVVLVMATEWRSVHGGLSTFNRHLCTALAKLGLQVYCAIPYASDDEIAHAKQLGVTLVVAAPTPGASELSGLSRRLHLPEDILPAIIIGHGRITGAFAKDQQTDFFRHAKRIHFVHMAPDEIEWFKEPEKAAEKVDAREKIEVALAADAQLVVAVGPRLLRSFADLLRSSRTSPRVVEFVPGPMAVADCTVPPYLNQCLVLGRADDWELKGLDIAARALFYVIQDKRYAGDPPELIIRGASPGTGAALRSRLLDLCSGLDVQVKAKEYSTEEHTIESDIRRAALLLMPSRQEGFGLVALEALSHGTPVLATEKSGFADIVRRLAPEHLALNAVVETPIDRDAAAKIWAKAIGSQLTDKKSAFARAAELGRLLVNEVNWDVAARQLVAEIEAL